MNTRNQDIQDQIIEAALEDVAFDGWTWDVIEQAAVKVGHDKNIALAVFPETIDDALAHFSDLADRWMLEALPTEPEDDMKVRERIKLCVQTRLECLNDHKEAVRAASVYWLVPTRKIRAAKLVWKTADTMWNWAGDTSEDYNHYTKRTLLSGVITTTTVRWLNDESDGNQASWAFLDRRIGSVLKMGGVAGKIVGPVLDRLKFLKRT